MRRSAPPRRGVALLAALVALAIVAALLTAAFFSALETDRSSRLLERQAEVRSAAERAVNVALSQWDTPARAAQVVGASVFVPPAVLAGHAGALVWVTRISARTYWLFARASDDRDSTVAASAGMVVRVDAPRFPRLAALVSRGGVVFAGPTSVTGNVGPGPQACDSTRWSLSAIVVPPGAVAPPYARMLSVAGADSTYTHFGLVDLNALAQRTGAVVPGGSEIAPTSTPLLVSPGDLTIDAGTGAGIVIAQGRIRLRGPIQFSGVVIGMGGLEVTTGDATIVGLAMSGSLTDSSVVVDAAGRFTLSFSECVVGSAELATAVARPAHERAVVQMP
jgi:hypothetical protein